MARSTRRTSTRAQVPAGLRAARATAKTAHDATTALRRLIDRVTVIDDGGFTELLLDGETIVGGNGPEAVWLREFGRLVDEVKEEPATPKATVDLLEPLKAIAAKYAGDTGLKMAAAHGIDAEIVAARVAITEAEAGS